MTHFRDILKNRNFVLLWLGQVISNFGDRLNQMALIGFVSQKTPYSTYELAKLMLFVIVPVFIIGPVAGAYVDRWNRRHIMIISDISRGFLVLLIPYSILHFKANIPIYAIVFLTFSVGRFFLPSKMAIIPSLVPRGQLLLANSLSDTTYMIATIVGFGLAGILVKAVGVLGGFYIDSASFFLSAMLLSFIRGAGGRDRRGYRQDLRLVQEAVGNALRKGTSVWAQIKEGLAFITTYPKARFVISVLFLLMAGAGAILCIIIVFIQEKFGTLTTDVGLFGVFIGCGLLTGSLAYGRFGQRFDKEDAILASFILGGAGIAVFAVIVSRFPLYRVAGILSFCIGMVLGPVIVSVNTLLHETIPDDMRGRIFSSQEMVTHLAFLVFMFATSIMAEYLDKMWILIGCGVVFFLVGVFGLGGRSLTKQRML